MLMLGDCLERMKEIPDQSVDMVMCDLPYGTTQNKWDTIIPLEPLWAEYWRVCRGAVVLTAAQPFTSVLVCSQLKRFKYSWSWIKNKKTGNLNAKFMPMGGHEDVVVFGKNIIYNPQKEILMTKPGSAHSKTQNYGATDASQYTRPKDGLKSPDTAFFCPVERGLHPTQKPVALMDYMIRTYTNPGDVVLDNCMGSGTTGVAALDAARRFIGIERDEGYFAIAKKRIESCDGYTILA